jgi:hypothetical protein
MGGQIILQTALTGKVVVYDTGTPGVSGGSPTDTAGNSLPVFSFKKWFMKFLHPVVQAQVNGNVLYGSGDFYEDQSYIYIGGIIVFFIVILILVVKGARR